MLTRLTRGTRAVGIALTGAVLAMALLACGDGPAKIQAQDTDTTVAAAAADDVVRRFVGESGEAYAGDCASTRSPDDIGKVCSKLIEEKGGLKAYLIGRTFSEFSTWVFVNQTSAGFVAAGSEALDFFDTTGAVPWPR